MTNRRFNHLMRSEDPLTNGEIEAGWHFCSEFEGLLVGPGSYELEFCYCLPLDHKVYETRPAAEKATEPLPPI